tara:strand:+ start:374 stop:670 length:297 start_codon:yes stop_codon:yes gene_type:complete
MSTSEISKIISRTRKKGLEAYTARELGSYRLNKTDMSSSRFDPTVDENLMQSNAGKSLIKRKNKTVESNPYGSLTEIYFSILEKNEELKQDIKGGSDV